MKHPKAKSQWLIHTTFLIGIFLKALNGVCEVIGGLLLLIFSSETIRRWVAYLTQDELSEDPNDLLANFFLQTAENLSISSQIYGSLFLLSHGIVKLTLITCLLKKKLWAYPLAIAIFGAFLIYQMYLYYLTPTPLMFVLSAFDLLVIVLTYLEYHNLRSMT